MGMTIDDETYAPKPMSKEETVESLKTMIFGVQAFERFNAKERETLSRAWNLIDQYEARLKADVVAMLTDIQMEIHELENPYPHAIDNLLPLAQHNAFYDAKSTIEDLVEQKIDKLKENKDGTDNNI